MSRKYNTNNKKGIDVSEKVDVKKAEREQEDAAIAL